MHLTAIPKCRFKSLFRPWLLLLGAFCLAACGESSEQTGEEWKLLRVGITTSYLGEAATFVAQENGYFNDFGLDVILSHNPSGSVSIRELFDGNVEIAHVAETPVVYSLMDTAYYRGAVPPFRILADMIYSHKIQKIVAHSGRGISGPRDIIGRRVAIYKGTQLDYYFDSFLLENHIPADSVTTVNIDPVEQVEAIEDGRVDVAVNWEPYASYIQNRLGMEGTILKTDLTYSTLWMAAAREEFVKTNPETLTAYLKAIQKAQRFINDNPQATQEIMSRHTGIPLKVIASLWEEIDYELSLSERMLTLLEDQARWMIRNGIADRKEYNFGDLINYEPMRKVHPEGITVIK